jgi:hypothetical protein
LAYKTIFEQIQEETGGRSQSREWYREKVFDKSPEDIISEERSDEVGDILERDQNRSTSFPILFNLMLYKYKAKTRRDLPYYDKYPLSFVLEMDAKSFFAVNLHYYSPEERMGLVMSLAEDKIPRFRKGAHKYLISEVRSPYLILAQQEWQTMCLLPVEEFVRDLSGVEIPIPSDKVWGR